VDRVEIGSKSGGIYTHPSSMELAIPSRRVESIHFKGTDQPLLRDGVETFRASTVITEPYVMADKTDSAREFRQLK